MQSRTGRGARILPLLALATLALGASACESGQVEVATAQPETGEKAGVTAPAAAAEAAPVAPIAPAYAPEDTATRTTAEAVRKRLALRADSIAELAPSSDSTAAAAPRRKYNAGEDPEYAASRGWPVLAPKPLPGALLPEKRILCYYGNPNSKRMGVLGEYPKDEMLQRLDKEVAKWDQADPAHPAMPCLHMVAVVAQGEPGTSGHYRTIVRDTTVNEVYNWAKSRDGIFIVDIQTGTDRIQNLLPRFEWILKNPDVHLAVDPEFMMKGGQRPGTKIGTMDAADINYATAELARIVRENNLPPKVLVIHRFTRKMVTNSEQIKLRPEVQIVMDMDGWGAPWLKRDSYRDYIVQEPVEHTGFKLFYHNDTKKGDPLMQPADLMKLHPVPLYIQYQ